MGKLSLASSSTEFLPRRPNFGTQGTKTVLWANYFKLNVKALDIYKYSLNVIYGGAATAGSAKQEEEDPKGKKVEKGGKGEAKEAKGKKLGSIIELAMKQFPATPTYASEFKAQVITLGKLKFSNPDGTVEVKYTEAGRSRAETWTVKFNGPESVHVDRLLDYFGTMHDLAGDATFPKFPTEVDAIGIVLGHTPRTDKDAVTIGRGRHFALDEARSEAAPMNSFTVSILRGYFQSVRPATGRLLLNVHVTHAVFRQPIRLDELLGRWGDLKKFYSKTFTNLQPHTKQLENMCDKLHKFLKKSRVRHTVPATRTRPAVTIETPIAGLAHIKDACDKKGGPTETSPKFRFQFPYSGPENVKFFLRRPDSEPATATGLGNLRYDTWVTVNDYWIQKYGVRPNLDLPLVNVGTVNRPMYIPAEQCSVLPGQLVKSKLTPGEQEDMIRFACRFPADNAQSIVTKGRALLALDGNKLLAKFGITVDKELLTVTARELPPPLLNYLRRKSTAISRPEIKDGGWLLRNEQVSQSGRPIAAWSYIHIQAAQHDNAEEVKRAVYSFVEFMESSMGVRIAKQGSPGKICSSKDALPAVFKSLPANTQFVIVVLPDKQSATYNLVKQLGDVTYGIMTVCVQRDMVTKQQGQQGYFANVALKVNLKFGGINQRLTNENELIKGGKTMVVGYDVTHPTNLAAGGGGNAPSMVGLVSSIDSDLAQWPALAWANPPKQEMAESLESKFQSRLELWRSQQKNKGQLPENIIIFRDGVSEGQFNKVLEVELPRLRKACMNLYKASAQPRIALIVSVKRHQTRFFPTDPAHATHRSKSPKEGTVVDRGVTSVRYWDFFLQAHVSLQGTARPAHYTVLLDEIFRPRYGDRAADALEKLTHDMCYLYGRATKAVSICPPAYYADLVCTRARAHQSELYDDASTVKSGGLEQVKARHVHQKLENTMYYI
ncbi:ribonuclease H-like domain-containing protein [Diplogelasinospora grovesii]|uniref:Ribonuclease H-like domain-containing protein n=1 Tax=Diplogelasinospora grovesii TaxID=303347 RepID=A0AAN6NKA3_9PEZI|nr:ribonuclease H-like domain-containing protein [Diplogelasinospora grovesii]